MTISNIIERHAPLQVAARRQKRVQQKTRLAKGLLVSIKNKQKLYKCYFLNGNEFQRYFFKKYAIAVMVFRISSRDTIFFCFMRRNLFQ